MTRKHFGFVFCLTLFLFDANFLLAADEPVVNQPHTSPESVVLSEFIYDTAPFASCHASTIAETPDGALVAAWFAGSREGAPDVGIWVACREKNGAWSEPVEVAQGVGDDGNKVPCWNPVLYQWRDGPLVLYFKVGPNVPLWHGETLVSRNGGKSWGERKRLPEFFVGPVKNKPIQLADGTLLAGSSIEGGSVDFWRIHVERQPSFGATWSRTAELHTPEEGEAIQPSILTYPDGSLQMICRTRNGRSGSLWQIWSADNGQTWGTLQPLDLPNPNSGTDAATLADGRQLLVYNHTNRETGGRGFLNVAVSEDGCHWSAVCVLENAAGGEFSYPAVIQSADGFVHITYTWRREKIKHVVLDPARFVPAEIKSAVWPKAAK